MAWTFGHSLLLILALAGGAAAGWALRARQGTNRTPAGPDTAHPGPRPTAASPAAAPTIDTTRTDAVDQTPTTTTTTTTDGPTTPPAAEPDDDAVHHTPGTDPHPQHTAPGRTDEETTQLDPPHPAAPTITAENEPPATPVDTAPSPVPPAGTSVDATTPAVAATLPPAPEPVPTPEPAPVAQPSPAVETPTTEVAAAHQDVASTEAAAPAPAASTAATAPAEPARPAADTSDDFRRIQGIGPKIATALQAAGVRTYRQLAELDEPGLREVIRTAGLRSAPGLASWPQQARLLADAPDETARVLPATNGS